MPKKILILGAGYAGIEAALTLYKRKRKKDNIDISIIDKNSYQTIYPILSEIAGGRINPETAAVPLMDIFKYTDIHIIKDLIVKADLENKKLLSKSTEYEYDYLILAPGCVPETRVPGVNEYGLPLGSVEDAIQIREHIKDRFLEAKFETDVEKRSSLLTIVICGAGFTGVETAGEIARWIPDLCREYSISKNEIKIILIESGKGILKDLSKENQDKALKILHKNLKVIVKTDCEITSIASDSVRMGSGDTIKTFSVIWTGGIKGADIVKNIYPGIGDTDNIPADPFARTLDNTAYAAGSAASFNSGNYLLPNLINYAVMEGKLAAMNILNSIRDKDGRVIHPQLFGISVSIGAYHAVGKFIGLRLWNLLAVILKYLINIKYLFHFGGFELTLKYLKSELILKKQTKFILAENYSKLTPAFWLVPIRLFLGYSWLMEGIKKINEGWLSHPLLVGISAKSAASAAAAAGTEASSGASAVEGAVEAVSNAITNAAVYVTDMLSNTDAATGASENAVSQAVTNIASALSNAGTNINAAVVSGVKLFRIVSAGTPAWYAWIANSFIIPNAMVFQFMITFTELAVGLALISGTFTFVFGLAALTLDINFLLSTGMYPSDWWYIPAAITMLGGAGKSFGVDHYLMPYLARQWRYFIRNKKFKFWLWY